jgi:hypothetical protein
MVWRAGATALAVVALAGCGSGDGKAGAPRDAQRPSTSSDRGTREADRGGEEQDKGGVSALPVEDRRAFLQIGAAASNLRTGGSLVLVKGFAPAGARTTLRRLRRNVLLLKPRDPRLRRLRAETLAALSRGIRAPRAARAMLADAGRLQQGLKEYSGSHPAIGTIAPE